MNYATGYACSLNDILVKFPYEKLDSIKGTKLQKKRIIKKIFKESIKEIIQDIIDNNVSFQLPSSGTNYAEIHMEPFKDSDFERVKQNGKFKDIDFLESLFTGYQPYLYIKSKYDKYSVRKKKPIYLNKFFKDQITENTNNGKQYC